MQSNHVCNKNANNAEHLQRANFKQTSNVYKTSKQPTPQDHNGKSHDSHNYNLRKRRPTECKDYCIYQCLESEKHANNSLLPNLPSKDQSLANLNKLYSNPNSIYSCQIISNSISVNSCKICTLTISSIPLIQNNSFGNPLLFITPKLLCLNLL